MSGHTVGPFERWTIAPDRRADAEPVTHALQCTVCPRTSPRSKDAAEVERWAANHAERNTLHDRFRAITHAPYRAVRPGPGA